MYEIEIEIEIKRSGAPLKTRARVDGWIIEEQCRMRNNVNRKMQGCQVVVCSNGEGSVRHMPHDGAWREEMGWNPP